MVERKTDEKRGAARFPFHRPMSYRVTGGPDSPPNEVNSTGEITNLSQGGMAMRIGGADVRRGDGDPGLGAGIGAARHPSGPHPGAVGERGSAGGLRDRPSVCGVGHLEGFL